MPQYQRQQNMNIRNRRHRRMYRRYQRRVRSINNQDMLNRIKSLPRQFNVNSLIDGFFNGTPFIETFNYH